MATQINPRLARLWLADDIRQYGYKSPLILESLSEPELRILDYLETGITTSQMSALPAIARTEKDVVDRVVAKLSPVLSESGRLPVSYNPAEVKTHFSELARLFGPQTPFADALEKRRSARIFIESIGRTGLVIANALSASEFGTLLTLDQLRVGEEDCLPLGHPRSHLGIPRATSAKRQLESTQMQFHSRRSATLEKVSIAILIADDIVRPSSYQPWISRDIPHLAICFDQQGVEISPLIVPETTPCIGCIEKAKFETDEHWRTIAPQLLARDRSNQDSAMMLFATGVVTNLILNHVDQSGFTSTKSLRLNRSGSLGSFEPATSHCGCGLGGSRRD